MKKSYDFESYEIRPITTAMFEEVHEFLEDNFFTCAPIARSLGMCQKKQFWTWAWVESCLMEEESLAAMDRNNQVVGVIIGKTSLLMDLTLMEKIIDFIFGGGWEEWLGELIWKLCWWFSWFLPSYYANYTKGIFSDIFLRLGYDESKIMTNLKCQKMWVISVLCVDKNQRQQGIASNLVKCGTLAAQRHQCDCSAVIVSNIYSEKVFLKNNFERLSSISFESVKDRKGKKLLSNVGEHSNITLMTKKWG